MHTFNHTLRWLCTITAVVTLLFVLSTAASAQTIQWTRQFEATSSENALAVAFDGSQNLYTVGETDSSGLSGQSSIGGTDAYIRKYDSNGTELWTRQFGSNDPDGADGIAVDATGVYVTGEQFGFMIYVRKFDLMGAELWTRFFGQGSYYAEDIIADATGVYVAGGRGTGGDALVLKYDSNGTELWTRQFGTALEDGGFDLSFNPTGIYIAGATLGTFPGFISGGGIDPTDAFVRKYDINGHELGTYQFGTQGYDAVYGIAAGATDVYIVGITSGTFPGQTNNGSYDALVMKLVGDLPNQPPQVLSTLSSVTKDEGQVAINSGTYADVEEDPVTLTASVGTVTNNNNGTWSWSYQTQDGPMNTQTVTIMAEDGRGGMTQTSFNLTVNNVVPTVNPVTVPVVPIAIGEPPVSVTVAFGDPAGTFDAPYSCTVDYGDGTGPHDGSVSDMICAGSYSYAHSGVYTVTASVMDKDGGVVSRTAEQFIVVYDPTDGFVTGSGWIQSQSGWCHFDPSCASTSGKAVFGFVSKYAIGASIPTGNTLFNFSTGGLRFNSNAYQWLVINQNQTNAQYKGSGSINNSLAPTSNPYQFMIWAKDADPSTDTFRIKIWYDVIGAEIVVYDNGFDQTIGGGSIEIHG